MSLRGEAEAIPLIKDILLVTACLPAGRDRHAPKYYSIPGSLAMTKHRTSNCF